LSVRGGTQINQICASRQVNAKDPPTAHNGGSARGYQELPAQSSTPTTASGQAASSYVYALSALV
jgi:hypothetical protein